MVRHREPREDTEISKKEVGREKGRKAEGRREKGKGRKASQGVYAGI